ncbi:uncharacterized protein TNCV_2321611 [Trichonephila clavipes]|nr:uncharacterized protein TNCV_2321611 [Trichonephila clavipes]
MIVRTQATMKKEKYLILKENPPTQRFIASNLGMYSGTVSEILHKDLKLKKRLKLKVRLFLPKHVAERKTNVRKLCAKHLDDEKWKFGVTLDEAWVYLMPPGRQRPDQGPRNSSWQRAKGSMSLAVALSTIQQSILEPIFEEGIPALYGKDIDKFELHMDKASIHLFKSSAAYLAKKETKTGIKCDFMKYLKNHPKRLQWTLVLLVY